MFLDEVPEKRILPAMDMELCEETTSAAAATADHVYSHSSSQTKDLHDSGPFGITLTGPSYSITLVDNRAFELDPRDFLEDGRSITDIVQSVIDEAVGTVERMLAEEDDDAELNYANNSITDGSDSDKMYEPLDEDWEKEPVCFMDASTFISQTFYDSTSTKVSIAVGNSQPQEYTDCAVGTSQKLFEDSITMTDFPEANRRETLPADFSASSFSANNIYSYNNAADANGRASNPPNHQASGHGVFTKQRKVLGEICLSQLVPTSYQHHQTLQSKDRDVPEEETDGKFEKEGNENSRFLSSSKPQSGPSTAPYLRVGLSKRFRVIRPLHLNVSRQDPNSNN